MNIKQLKNSIVIVIQPDGQHNVCLPKDESLEISSKAHTQLLNSLAVMNEPSYFILSALWLERQMQSLSRFLFKK